MTSNEKAETIFRGVVLSIFFDCIGGGSLLRIFKGESVCQDSKAMVQGIYPSTVTRTKAPFKGLWWMAGLEFTVW